MKATPATARFFLILAAWATLPFAATLHGAEFSLPFTENFQSSSFLDSTKTTARWTSSGVTLEHSRGRHMEDLGSMPRDRRIGNSLSTSAIHDIAARDMNGDSRLDVLIANDDGVFAYLVGEVGGLGTLQPVEVTTAGAVKAMVFGDFDRDGDLDVVAVATGDRNEVVFYGNEGNGHAFRKHSRVSDLRIAALVSADMDSDGDLDLVLAREGRGVEVHLNDGRGNFRLKENAVSAPRNRNKTLGVGDLDGDGDMDIVLAQVRGMSAFHLNRGDAGFGPHQPLHHTGNQVDYRDIAIGDVNNDGHVDILVGVRQGQNILYLNNGGGSFGEGSRINNSGARTVGVYLVDMDGDGDLDIVEGAAKKGSRIYLNQGGTFASGPVIDGKTGAIAVGDVDGDGHPGLIIGENPASLKVLRLEERSADGPATARFETWRGRVVSRRVDIDGQVPHVVYLTATAVPSTHTAIDYYLSNDDGNHWRRAYPGQSARFLSPGNRLRWRAELKSRSPALSTTLTQIGVEGVLQVSIDGIVQRSDGDFYRASSRTVGDKVEAVLKLENRSDRPLETGIDFTGEGFRVENGPDSIPPGSSHSAVLVFEPTRPIIHPSKLMISSTESGIALHRFELPLRGVGLAAEINLRPRVILDPRVGSSATQIVEVENRGNLNLKIDHPPTISTSRFVLIDPDPSSGFPLTVTASESVNLEFRFKPEARGTVTGSVTFVSNAIGTTETITLQGKGLASDIDVVINDTPMSQAGFLYHFNDWPVNAVTSARVDITNADGDASLRVEPLEPLDSTERRHFSLMADKPFPLAVGEFDTEESVLTLNFRPKNHGPQTATIVFVSDAINGTQTITLTGRGLGSEMQLGVGDKTLAAGTTHTFSATKVNTSRTVAVQVHNHGNVPMNISTPTLAKVGDLTGFSLVKSGGLPDTVPEGSSASFTFRFQPTMPGTATALATFTSDAVNATRTTIALQGRGTAPMISVTPTGTIQFGDVPARTSTDRHVTITNTGDAVLEVTSARVVNGGAAELLFSVVRPAQFPHPVGVGEDLTLTVRFSPLEQTDRNVVGTLDIKSDAFHPLEKRPRVSGIGVVSTMAIVIAETNANANSVLADGHSILLHDFGDVPISTSASRRVFISNRGGKAPLRVEIPPLGEAGPFRWQNDPVPEVVAVEADKSTSGLILVFEPEEPGPQVTTLTFVSNAFSNATQTVTLKGRGVGAVMVVQVGGTTLTSSETFDLRTRLNREVTTDIVVWNRGNADLMVDNIGLVSGNDIVERAGRYRLPGGGRTIQKNTFHTWTLRFTPPDVATTHRESIRITSSNEEVSPLTLHVHGVGTKPDLATGFRGCSREPDIHCEVEGVRVGVTTSVELVISNRGNELLTGTVTMVHSDEDYRVYDIDQTGDFMVAPRESTARTISFFPSDANINSPGWEPPTQYARYWRGTWVKIKTNDPDKRERVVDVWSRVVGPEMHVDIGEPVPAYTGSAETRKQEHDSGGEVMVGRAEAVPLIIRNFGNEPLMVTANVSGSVYRLLNEDGSSAENRLITIGAGLDEPLTLRFLPPTVTTPYEEMLTITSNDHDEGVYEVVLTGRGRERPRMQVEIAGKVRWPDGSPYRFSPQKVGTTASVAVKISNNGNDNLMIESIGTTATTLAPLVWHSSYLAGGLNSFARLYPPASERYRLGYSISGSRHRTIEAGSSATVMLHFSPSMPSREDNALLVLKSDDSEHPDWTLDLKGSGTGPLLSSPDLIRDSGYRRITGTTTFFYDMGEAIVYEKPRMPLEQPAGLFYPQIVPDTRFSRPQPRYRQHRYWGIHNWGNENLRATYVDMEEGSPDFHPYGHESRRLRNLVPDGRAGGGINFIPKRPGVHTGTFVITSNDVTLPELRVEFTAKGIAPGIDVQASGFGDVPVGGSSTARVVVRNDGDAPLTISGVAVDDGSQFSANVVFSDFPVVLTGTNSRFVFDVFFAPVELGVSTAALIVLSDAFRESTHTVVLRGTGSEPEIEFGVQVGGQVMGAQTPLNFGRVRAGMTTAVTVAVENKGSSVLNIKPLLRGDDDYSLANSDTRVIAPNSSGSWVLRFHPESSGSRSGMLNIVNANNHSERFRRLNLTGVGVKSGIQVEIDGTVYRPEMQGYKFGKIGYGTSRTAEVTITNTGDAALNIKSIGVTPHQLEYTIHYKWIHAGIFTRYQKVDTGYSLAGNNIRTLPAGSSASFTLHFTPVIPLVNSGVLKIVSDNPEHPEWNLNLTGRGTGPLLKVFHYWHDESLPLNSLQVMHDTYLGKSSGSPPLLYMNLGDSVLRRTAPAQVTGEGFRKGRTFPDALMPHHAVVQDFWFYWTPIQRGTQTGTFTVYTDDKTNPVFPVRLQAKGVGPGIAIAVNSSAVISGGVYNFGDIRVDDSSQTQVRVDNDGDSPLPLEISDIVVEGGNGQFSKKANLTLSYPVVIPHEANPWSFDVSFAPTRAGPVSARLVIHNSAYGEKTYTITLRGNGVGAPAPSAWADGTQRPAIPTFTTLESDIIAPRFVGLGYADWQSRLWLAFDEPAQILSGADARVLADGVALSGFKVLANYTGGGVVEDIGVLRARYRSGGVVMDLARGIVSADASLWARYTPPSDGVSGIYDLADPPNRISSVRLFMLPRSAVMDYDGDGFPDALEARLGGNPLVADDVAGLPEVALLRPGAVGSPAAVAYSGIRADGVAAHLGVVTTGTSSLAAYYLSDTFGYSGGYAENVGGYGCTEQFPADYASALSEGGCAVVDFNSIRAGVEHRIGWLATNAAGYWAVAEGTASRLPEQVILRVPEFNMKRRNVFVANSAAADETVIVGAFHDGPASLSPLAVSLSNVAAADSPSSSQPDGFSVSVADMTTDTTSYAITGVHSGEDSKLWLAGDPLSSLTPDKYSLGKVTQTDVVRLADDNLPPLFGRALLYVGTTASENERHAVVVRGTENYIALLPVVQGSAQTASAFGVSPWDGAGGGPVAADDRILAVNEASPVADGALVRIAFTATNPPAAVRNTVSLEVAASSAGASTATTVLTWPVIDNADALASVTGDNDNDGIPDVRDSYHLLNRLPISVAGGVSGYPDRNSAGADGWHHIRPLLPLHSQHIGGYAMRAGLSFSTGFAEGGLILGRVYITTPEQQPPLATDYQPGIPIQMNYADFAASLSHDEFASMAQQSRQDIAVVYNFRLHGVEPSVAQGAEDTTLAGGRAGVVIPLPESLRETASILPLHYTSGAWSGFSTGSDAPATAGFAPLQAGVCPDDSGVAGSPYRTESGALNTRKRAGDACMVLYLTDGAAADRDGNLNGVVDALIGLAVIVLPRTHPTAAAPHSH